MKVSIVITTYNSPRYLDWCLASVGWQAVEPCQLIIADDGSRSETQAIIEKWRYRFAFPLIHSFQPDDGFRLSRSRNLASLRTEGDWIVFIDGDCVMPPDFLARVSSLLAKKCLLFGSRKLLSSAETATILGSAPNYGSMAQKFSGKKFLRIPLGFLRRFPRRSWKCLRGFLMALRREDLFALQGFNENYRSWGLEDSEFAIRAIRFGLTLTDLRYKTSVLHLYHPEPSTNAKSENSEMFRNLIKDSHCCASPKSCLVGGDRAFT